MVVRLWLRCLEVKDAIGRSIFWTLVASGCDRFPGRDAKFLEDLHRRCDSELFIRRDPDLDQAPPVRFGYGFEYVEDEACVRDVFSANDVPAVVHECGGEVAVHAFDFEKCLDPHLRSEKHDSPRAPLKEPGFLVESFVVIGDDGFNHGVGGVSDRCHVRG